MTVWPMRFPMAAWALSIAALLAACASGPTYLEMEPSFPPLAPGDGRVFFYRPATSQPTSSASLRIDGKVAPAPEAMGFTFLDLPAGRYEVSVWGLEGKASFDLPAGETRFVRVLPTTLGIRFNLFEVSLVPSAEAQREIATLKYGVHPLSQ